jgi:deoxyribonuclease-4
MLRIGYHLSIAGSLDLAFDRGAAIGCTAMQIFVTNPRGWETKSPISSVVRDFREKAERLDILPVCHMPYLPNLGSTNEETYRKSILSFQENLGICDSLGIKYLITHLGSHLGKGRKTGLENVVNALEDASGSLGSVTVLLENQAGHANSIGAKLEDLIEIYESSSLAKKGRLGFCLDTCHLFAAGYDIRVQRTWDEIDRDLGLEKVHAFHMNDAKFGLGSGKDRHDNIGRGYVGKEGFATIMKNRKITSKILILETPPNPELEENEEMELLRKLYE